MEQLTDFEKELASENTARELAARYDEECSSRDAFLFAQINGFVFQAKQLGYSDVQLATLWVSRRRFSEVRGIGVYPSINSSTPAPPSSRPRRLITIPPMKRHSTRCPTAEPFEWEDEIRLTDKPKVIIIGGGPNRIGQGIEFDYCCVQAAFAMKELGLESVMINSNPETVSTDYDTSDLLFFEPLTHEDVLNVCERLNGGPFNSGGHCPP
jgi:carbamoyl-phosphate synthase large subunit